MRRLDDEASNRVPDKLDRIASMLSEMGARLQKLEERGGGATSRTDANTPHSIASSLGFFRLDPKPQTPEPQTLPIRLHLDHGLSG
jgi:hypothetical protein